MYHHSFICSSSIQDMNRETMEQLVADIVSTYHETAKTIGSTVRILHWRRVGNKLFTVWYL